MTFISCTVLYIILEVSIMISFENTSFSVSDSMIDLSSFKNDSLDQFKDSFNMLVGTTNTEINLFSNPYIEVNVYYLDENWTP